MSKVNYVETRRFRSIKSSGATSRVRRIKETDVLRTMSVFIIRDVMWYLSLRNGRRRSSRDVNMTPPTSLLLASQNYNVTALRAIYMRHRGLRCHSHPWWRGTRWFSKRRFLLFIWNGWLPEKILLNPVAAKASDHKGILRIYRCARILCCSPSRTRTDSGCPLTYSHTNVHMQIFLGNKFDFSFM
jgi:hypothetical protein